MRRIIIAMIAVLTLICIGKPGVAEERSLCQKTDVICGQFETLAQEGQFKTIIDKAGGKQDYSEGARYYIGKAYLAIASDENNRPEQEEAFCRKALEFGATQAYMGLYFIYVQKDEEQALGFLREYVNTKPRDTVPYVILGESELNKKNYKTADFYLRESKKVARASSPRVDWMLFQVNYLLGNYKAAGEMMESALTNGTFEQELKELAADGRFKGMETRPEFKTYQTRIAAAGK
jgi:tetratricopeptide (TPR) repeat protein